MTPYDHLVLRLKGNRFFQQLAVLSSPSPSGLSARQRELGQPSSSYIFTPIGFGGLQFLFFTFASQGVTHFNSLGLTRAEIAVALLAPPITGGFFQPYFGNWSDQLRSPWGRRKPFIVVGTAVLIFSMLCLGWAGSIAQVLARSTAPQDTPRPIIVAVAMFWTLALFIALQAVQVGLRALITDDCTPLEQARANAWASGYTNLAAALLNLFAYMDLPLFRGVGNTVFTNMSLLAIGMVTVTIFISCLTSTEKQPTSFPQRTGANKRSLGAIWRFFFTTSKQIRRICLIQIFAWSGWFPFLFYTVTYTNGLHERELERMPRAQAEREQGAHMGALTMLVFSIVALVMATLLPTLVSVLHIFSMSGLWVITQALFGVSMLGTYVVRSSHGTVFLFGVVGFSWAASTWVPYALLGAETARAVKSVQLSPVRASPSPSPLLSQSPLPQSHSEAASMLLEPDEASSAVHRVLETDNLISGAASPRGSDAHYEDVEDEDLSSKIGLIYGIHNLSICIPQILLSLGMGFVWMVTDEGSGGASRSDAQQSADLVWILRLGGIAAFVGMYYAIGLQEPFVGATGGAPHDASFSSAASSSSPSTRSARRMGVDAHVARLSVEGAGV